MSNYWKNFQDLTPVVLTKKKSITTSTSIKNKSNIHINNNDKIIDDNEAHRIQNYSMEQRQIIINGRNALGLKQIELARKISSSLKGDFIENIENTF